MFKNPTLRRLLRLLGLTLLIGSLAAAIYQLPAVHDRLSWRLDFAGAYIRGVIHPVQQMPTPSAHTQTSASDPQSTPSPTSSPEPPTQTPSPSPTLEFTPTITPSPTPIPDSVNLPPPDWIKQGNNNCGPATLAMALHFYGWEGTQDTIAAQIKPMEEDRNVNVEELVFFARNNAGWLQTEYRVGGNIDMIRRMIAAGIPVVIEEEFIMRQSYWPNDDRWAGHYLLVTGYDDATRIFTAQDVFVSANLKVSYEELDKHWQTFNRVYILLYPAEKTGEVQSILGEDWDAETNRENALALSRSETETDPENAYAWFNLGTNLAYFEKYNDAAKAYDEARRLGLPQRMLRYQFGPFMAYFHSLRTDDLMTLTEYALKITPNSEEALLWRGWGYYRQGDIGRAIDHFSRALAANPGYHDAGYALDFVQKN